MKKLTIKDLQREILLMSVLFLVALLAGLLSAQQPPLLIQMALNDLVSLAELAGDSDLNMFTLIFLNNVLAVFSIILGGLFFALGPVFSGAVNGYVIGVVSGMVILEGQGLTLLPGLVPHGIIEIPMLILALAAGAWLGQKVWQAVRARDFKAIWPSLKNTFSFGWRVLLPLMALAAFIEAFISSRLLDLMIG